MLYFYCVTQFFSLSLITHKLKLNITDINVAFSPLSTLSWQKITKSFCVGYHLVIWVRLSNLKASQNFLLHPTVQYQHQIRIGTSNPPNTQEADSHCHRL